MGKYKEDRACERCGKIPEPNDQECSNCEGTLSTKSEPVKQVKVKAAKKKAEPNPLDEVE